VFYKHRPDFPQLRLIICPCCAGAGCIEPAAPVPLTPTQFLIWDVVRRSRQGLTAPEIAAKVYADRYDGGPLHAKTCIYLTIRSANRRLQAAGVAIASTTHRRGAVYKIVPTLTREETNHAESQ
jgi:hypothetical protein